jgi:hypothetical protein
MGCRADNESAMEIIALVFILVVGPLAVFFGADSRKA